MKVFSYTENEFTENMNIGKDVLARGLYQAGIINNDQRRAIEEDFAIILASSNLFGKAVKKALGWDDNETYFKVIQLNNFNNNNNKEKEDVHQPEDSDTGGVDNGSD